MTSPNNPHQEKIDHLYRFAEFGRHSCGMFHDLMRSLMAVIASIDCLERKQEHIPLDTKLALQKAIAASKALGAFIETVQKQAVINDIPRHFCVAQEIQEALIVLRYRANQTNTTLLFSPTKPIVLYGNSCKFHHAIVNIVANAIDACEHTTRKGIVRITLSSTKTFVIIAVKDNGCGIPPVLQSKIFNPFFTTKHRSKGIGVGLSATKHTIEHDFGGTLRCSSTEGKGSIFIITIPYKNNPD